MSYQSNIKILRDAEIVNILANSAEFSNDAVDAAYDEFEERQLEHSILEQAIQSVQITQAEHLLRSEVPLSPWYKLFYFLFPLAMFAPLIYEKEGFERKNRESRKSIILGFCFYIMIILLFSLLSDKSDESHINSSDRIVFEQN